jgi:hypothetical protein
MAAVNLKAADVSASAGEPACDEADAPQAD